MPDNNASRMLRGKTLSLGMGEGKVFVYKDILTRFDEFYDIDEAQVGGELKGLDRALARISENPGELASRAEREIDSELSGVFRAFGDRARPKPERRDREGDQCGIGERGENGVPALGAAGSDPGRPR